MEGVQVRPFFCFDLLIGQQLFFFKFWIETLGILGTRYFIWLRHYQTGIFVISKQYYFVANTGTFHLILCRMAYLAPPPAALPLYAKGSVIYERDRGAKMNKVITRDKLNIEDGYISNLSLVITIKGTCKMLYVLSIFIEQVTILKWPRLLGHTVSQKLHLYFHIIFCWTFPRQYHGLTHWDNI